MKRFAFVFTLRSETITRLMDRPGDRARVFETAVEAVDGVLVEYYWMFGQWDGLAIVDLPDSDAAVAISLALTSTGSFGHIQTQELFASERIAGILGVANGAASGQAAA